jgi:hypothetical protein
MFYLKGCILYREAYIECLTGGEGRGKSLLSIISTIAGGREGHSLHTILQLLPIIK